MLTSRASALEATPFKLLENETQREYIDRAYRLVAFVVQCREGHGVYTPSMLEESSEVLQCQEHLSRAEVLVSSLEHQLPSSSKTQMALHALLWGLFTEEMLTDFEVAYFDYLLVQYLIAHCMGSNGKIQDVHQIPPKLARIQWLMRTTAFKAANDTEGSSLL